ncbi:MAG: hypothetical protein Ct9H300mP15_13680 [Gemmatimonadota bacterium]|nr:MAG: hypothetical protein Ct9H300mP15_13680 [Gemmatimonadota bacterium]
MWQGSGELLEEPNPLLHGVIAGLTACRHRWWYRPLIMGSGCERLLEASDVCTLAQTVRDLCSRLYGIGMIYRGWGLGRASHDFDLEMVGADAIARIAESMSTPGIFLGSNITRLTLSSRTSAVIKRRKPVWARASRYTACVSAVPTLFASQIRATAIVFMTTQPRSGNVNKKPTRRFSWSRARNVKCPGIVASAFP